jgi:hypothetical protein
VGGRVLRSHVEDHPTPSAGRLILFRYHQLRQARFAHNVDRSLSVAARIGVLSLVNLSSRLALASRVALAAPSGPATLIGAATVRERFADALNFIP